MIRPHDSKMVLPEIGLKMLRLLTVCCLLLMTNATNAKAIEHDAFQSATPVRHFDFEIDEDQDFDGHPDDWIRRKGDAFPRYVEMKIDRTQSASGRQSLLLNVNGGQAILYSPLIPVDSLHSYVFQGRMRTYGLKNDAAVISISLLNHKRQRVQRFLSQAVTGTYSDFLDLRIGPISPRPEVRFIVIGCHLVPGRKKDIDGKVWFDDLRLGMLPQLTLVSNFASHFVKTSSPIEVTARVTGLDPGDSYRLFLRMTDSTGREIGASERELKPTVESTQPDETKRNDLLEEHWQLEPQKYGFYRVQSTLSRNGKVILEKTTAFTVMDLATQLESGEFGWSIANPVKNLSPNQLSEIAAQAGINWVKYPLWRSVTDDKPQEATRITELLESLQHKQITTVGLLNHPPAEMRNKFARNWTGISEIFSMSPKFWSPWLEPVIARYSSYVRYWQLDSESDSSFVGMNSLEQTLDRVKTEIDRIGRDTHVGIHWNWETDLPQQSPTTRIFFSVSNNEPISLERMIAWLKKTKISNAPRWVLLKPLPRSEHGLEERGADLVKRMVAARIGGAEAIFASDVFDEEHGLLDGDGSPTPLFLPWRTIALAIRGTEYIGSINMPNGSRNFAFARDGSVVFVVWNPVETTEEIFLGHGVKEMDIWGRQEPANTSDDGDRQIIKIGPVPKLLCDCSESITRWRLAVQYEQGRLRSQTGEHQEAILGKNFFPQGISGNVTLRTASDWEVDPNKWQLQIGVGETYRLPMFLTLPANASLGRKHTAIDFDIVADRQYKFRVYRPYQVGIGDVQIEVATQTLSDGRMEIQQIISNSTSPPEELNLRCSLFVPGHKRQVLFVTKLASGQDIKYFYLPDAESVKGKVLWLRAEQVGGRRVLNYRWKVE